MTARLKSADGGKLRVLYVSDIGDAVGGAERSLLSLVEQLDQARYELFALLAEEGRFATQLRDAHVDVRIARLGTIARTRNPLKLLLYAVYFVHGVLVLRRLIKRLGIDVVHANKNTLAIHVIAAAWLARRASVWHVRNRASNFGRIGAWLVRRCSSIVFVSEAIGRPFRDAFPQAERKMTVIHEGIDTSPYAAREQGTDFRDSIGAQPGERLVGTVGRITPWKGQDDLLRAAALVAGQQADVRFVVVGDCVSSPAERGADEAFRDRLHALAAELGIGDRVVFTGYRDDVPAVMNGLDVFVLPSHEEPFGLVVLEAMAAARPIVATRAGGVPEIVSDGQEALLVPAGDVGAMADAILRVLGDEALCSELSRAAEKRVTSDFPLWRHAARMREVYGRLVARREG